MLLIDKVIESTNSKGIFKIIDKNNKPVSSLKNTNDYYSFKTNKYITKKSLFGGCRICKYFFFFFLYYKYKTW